MLPEQMPAARAAQQNHLGNTPAGYVACLKRVSINPGKQQTHLLHLAMALLVGRTQKRDTPACLRTIGASPAQGWYAVR